MNSPDEEYIGYLKYTGKSVESGLLDIRKSAEALLGFDDILRYFLLKEDPSLRVVDFEIPVRIKKGSWQALIPAGIIATFSASYVLSLGNKAATDGFLEVGPAKDIKKLFIISLKSAQYVIKLASHIGKFSKKRIEGTIVNKNLKDVYVKVPNQRGEYLTVPQKYFDLYMECPDSLFSKSANIVEYDRILELGVIEDKKSESVSITQTEKNIFYSGEKENDILFPELKHGQRIELEGNITRGNEKSNTIGFQYMDHILTSTPRNGNIGDFKNRILSQQSGHIFPKVKIIGEIDRTTEEGIFIEKRPRIIFTDIIPLEDKDKIRTLFDN